MLFDALFFVLFAVVRQRTINTDTADALAVGTLDLADAFIFFGLRSGVEPMRIAQSIAAGAIGREAARVGGWGTAALGVFLHFTIAAIIVAVYMAVSQRLKLLAERPFLFGPLYGVAAYGVMNWVVVPLSATGGATPVPGVVMLNGVLIHMFGVGLPAALAARVADRR